jgi:SNF family Na+-dependent transporter
MLAFVLFTTLFIGWVVPNIIVRNANEGAKKTSNTFFNKYMLFTLRFTAPIILIILFASVLFK